MSIGQTPAIGLLLGEDADINANWQKLDRAIRALTKEVIPESTIIQGGLEVMEDLEVHGITKLDNTVIFGADLVLTNAPLEVVGDMRVEGNSTFVGTTFFAQPPTFHDGDIPAAALGAGAGVWQVGVGTAVTSQIPIATSPAAATQLATLLMAPADDPARWELIVAQATIRFSLSSEVSSNALLNLVLRRGGAAGADQQTRALNYTLPHAGTYDVPLTMVRIAKPPTLDEPRWSLNGLTANVTGSLTLSSVFAQVHCIQFR